MKQMTISDFAFSLRYIPENTDVWTYARDTVNGNDSQDALLLAINIL